MPSASKTRSVPSSSYSYVKHRRKSGLTVGDQRQGWYIMGLLALLMLGAVGARLWYLQIVEGSQFRDRAENNRIRIVPKPPVRGNIFDQKGKVLATTRLSHVAYLWPRIQQQDNWERKVSRLAQALGVTEQSILDKVEQVGTYSPTLIRIARDLNPAQITAVAEYRSDLQNAIEIDQEAVRYYPNNQTAAHVLGYTGELNREELERLRSRGYRLGDVKGKMGVESVHESLLRGEWGGYQLEVDGAGRIMRVLGQLEAKAGQDITLALDIPTQKAAEAALGDRLGAIVAIDPKTGGIIAMASTPTFNPNIFSAPISNETWKNLQKKGNPFLNRSLRGFPPASTFKIVTATAGMESGKYPPNTVLNTMAYLRVGGTAFGEWNRAGFGPMGYVRAMAWSSNTFHGQIGLGVKGPTLIKWARLYGFGSKTGIGLAEESAGLIADDAWKRKHYDWQWTGGDTVNMSIGQGFTQATPLQVAVMFAVPANGGYLVKPHFLKKDPDKEKQKKSLNLKPSTLKTLQESLRAVVTSGTGKALNVSHLPPVAGKSGTAEAPPGKVHTWFGAYAPYDKPEIVVVAFGEHTGGGGGSVAGPMVRQVMEAYFRKTPKSEGSK
ncbi:MAG: penicillin-binding protein 2 [Microcystaceae cyanobacterium]